MKISIVLPSNRTSDAALARIFELGSLDPARFEVIVRDNSGNARKRQALESMEGSAVKPIFAAGAGPFENVIKSVRAATGDYIFPYADDDWLFARGLTSLYKLASEQLAAPNVSAITGVYLVESSRGCGPFSYDGIAEGRPLDRLRSFLNANVANYLYYSALKASVARFCFDFLEVIPAHFSFHDQLLSLSYLAHGAIPRVPRLLYCYDIGEWETMEATLSKDRSMYMKAGLPKEIDRLHWLICGLEGALLMRSAKMAASTGQDCTELGDLWFQFMFGRFINHDRENGLSETALGAGTRSVRQKWVDERSVDFGELLMDITEAIEISNLSLGEAYFKFWSSL